MISLEFIVNFLKILSLMVILGCAESSLIGEDLFGEEDFQVSYVDSLSVRISTVKYDSLATSNNEKLLIGRTWKEYLGQVTAESYFLLSLTSSDISEETRFDSITLVLPQSGHTYFLEDNEMIPGTILVEQLNEEFSYGDDGALYNISEFPNSTSGELKLLGSEKVTLSRDRVRTFEIRLDDEFGRDLFLKFREENEVSTDQTEFQEYINGFRVRFDTTGSSPFIGIDTDSIRLKMYYTSTDVLPPSSNSISFTIGSAPNYTAISTDVPDVFEELETYEDEVRSFKTNNLSLITGGIGYAVKVEFPTVKNLMLNESDYLIVGAELRLVPLDIYNADEELPETLRAIIFNENDEILSESLTATLHLDEEFGRDTYYALEVSTLIENMLEPYSETEYRLWITIDDEDIESSLSTIAIGDEEYGSELILYTITNK